MTKPDWRHLPVTEENLRYVHEEVRCVCGHDPSYHYDMLGFCMKCMDEDGSCDEFRDAPVEQRIPTRDETRKRDAKEGGSRP